MNTNALQKGKFAPNVGGLTILKRLAKAHQSIELKTFPLRMKKITSTSLNLMPLELIKHKSQFDENSRWCNSVAKKKLKQPEHSYMVHIEDGSLLHRNRHHYIPGWNQSQPNEHLHQHIQQRPNNLTSTPNKTYTQMKEQ